VLVGKSSEIAPMVKKYAEKRMEGEFRPGILAGDEIVGAGILAAGCETHRIQR